MEMTNDTLASQPAVRECFNRYYTNEKTERQSYDLVFPGAASGSTGLVLCIHGGAWVEGSKDSYADSIRRLCAEKGIAAAAINYRYLSDTVGFDDLLDDITSSLAAIRAEGERYGVTFDRALLTGVSAGGHLSLMYAYARKDAAPVKPVCVVELCGPTDLADPFYYAPENKYAPFLCGVIGRGVGVPIAPGDFEAARQALRKYSPLTYADENAVPTVFGHGEEDEVVPYANALALDKKLTACGALHTFVSFPDSNHGCEDKASMQRVMDLFFRCAAEYLG